INVHLQTPTVDSQWPTQSTALDLAVDDPRNPSKIQAPASLPQKSASKRACHEQSSSLHPASTVHGAPISLVHILGFICFSRRPDRDQRATHLTNTIWAEPIANEQQSSPKFAGQQAQYPSGNTPEQQQISKKLLATKNHKGASMGAEPINCPKTANLRNAKPANPAKLPPARKARKASAGQDRKAEE
ncbi:hypothetical protein ACLOJK_015082, partial [Asimina triloba]